jgi:hypothetical protein
MLPGDIVVGQDIHRSFETMGYSICIKESRSTGGDMPEVSEINDDVDSTRGGVLAETSLSFVGISIDFDINTNLSCSARNSSSSISWHGIPTILAVIGAMVHQRTFLYGGKNGVDDIIMSDQPRV